MINLADLQKLSDDAGKEYVEIPAEVRLLGMNRALNEKERLALAFLKSTLVQLNRLGALKSNFAEEQIPLFIPDSEPSP